MIFEEVEALVGVLRDTPGLTELEVCSGERRVRLRRAYNPKPASNRPAAHTMTASAVPNAHGVSAAAGQDQSAAPPPPAYDSTARGNFDRVERVTAGLVGIFRAYTKSPIADGDAVRKGQVLGQIEAMRLMTDCAAPVSGTLQSFFVDDGQPVQYGQPLFDILPEDTHEVN